MNVKNIGESVLSSLLDVLLLLHNGASFSFSNRNNTTVSLDKKKYKFTGTYKGVCSRKQYDMIIDKIKRMDIFTYKMFDEHLKTVVHKKNKYVEQDDWIAVTTSFVFDSLFVTSFVNVSVLNETKNSLVLCLTTASENVSNGYYRFIVKYKESTGMIYISYYKAQIPSTVPLRLLLSVTKDRFIHSSKTSVMNTINYLLQDKVLTLDDITSTYN